jgi:uncharacterized protein YjbI with pentapeptide repeats
MKDHILKILQMQQEGKLTQDQAAELLAVLADQARDKDGASAQHAPQGEAPGPRGEPSAASGKAEKGGGGGGSFNASAAFHSLVDTAVGMGTTVGRAASVWGTEFLSMVHRDEGGNSVTLSKVDSPHGDAFSFRDNSINVSKVAHLNFSQAQISGNTINASKLDHLQIARGRFVQSTISGSALTHLTIEGPAEAVTSADNQLPPAGIRAATFNASKFARVRITGASSLETTTVQATAAKDWTFSENSVLKDSRINDSHVAGLSLERATLASLAIERSHVQSLICRDTTLESVTFSGLKISDLTLTGGTLKNVKFQRESNSPLGGRDALLHESTFENCTLTDCDFAGCTFRRTTFRNLTLTGISVRNIDFTALKIESETDFRQAAGL